MPDLDATVVRSPEPNLVRVPGGFVMSSADTGSIFRLNTTAEAIWRRMAAPVTLRALSEGLTEEFDVDPERAASAVASLVSAFVEAQVAKYGERGLLR